LNSRMAIITYVDGGGSPDNTLPGAPVYPSQGLPGAPVYPSQGLPGLPPGAAQLPVFPFDPTLPDNTLPGSQPGPDNTLPGAPPRPDQGLPSGGRPTHPIAPGGRFIVKWFACLGLILVPDNTLPPTPQPK